MSQKIRQQYKSGQREIKKESHSIAENNQILNQKQRLDRREELGLGHEDRPDNSVVGTVNPKGNQINGKEKTRGYPRSLHSAGLKGTQKPWASIQNLTACRTRIPHQ